ncbi:hypothetical protein PMIN03_003989 [Paraphaeosphaeria minitans]
MPGEHAVSEGDGREQCHCRGHKIIAGGLGWLVGAVVGRNGEAGTRCETTYTYAVANKKCPTSRRACFTDSSAQMLLLLPPVRLRVAARAARWSRIETAATVTAVPSPPPLLSRLLAGNGN